MPKEECWKRKESIAWLHSDFVVPGPEEDFWIGKRWKTCFPVLVAAAMYGKRML